MAKASVAITSEDKLSPGLLSAKKKMLQYEQEMSKISNTISKAFTFTAVVAGLKAVVDGAVKCIQEFSEAEKVSKRLEAVWSNVGKTSGKTYDQIMAYSDAIEKQTYFTGEAIEESALLLAATESLSEDGFQRALDASIDLAAALGEDVTSAASLLAKAVQEPEAALSRLKTVGVSFTEDEKEQIKTLTDANQLYEAQSIILGKVEQKYQGVAKAINDTPSGTLDNIKDTLGDIRENLGSTLLDTISPALETLYGWLKNISEWVGRVNADSHRQNILGYAQGAGTAINPTYGTPNTNSPLFKNSMQALSKYTNAELKVLLDEVTELWNNTSYSFWNSDKQNYYDQILGLQAILEARKYTDIFGSGLPTPTGNSQAYKVTGYEDDEEDADEEIATAINNVSSSIGVLESFLKGKDSIFSKMTNYETVASEAQSLLDSINGILGLTGEDFFGGKRGELLQALGLDASTSDTVLKQFAAQLQMVILESNQKLADLMPQFTVGPSDLEKILDSYGSRSKEWQIDNVQKQIDEVNAVYESASGREQVILDEILGSLNLQMDELKGINKNTEKTATSFLDDVKGWIAGRINPNGEDGTDYTLFGKEVFSVDEDQAKAAASSVVDSVVDNLGEAGTLISNLAQNMASMGPVLGAIVTAFEYVMEGIGEVLGDVLNEFVEYGLEPLREFGRMIGNVLMPIMDAIMPSVESTAEFLIGIVQTIGTVLEPIAHIIGVILKPALQAIGATLEFILPFIKAIGNAIVSVLAVFDWFFSWVEYIFGTLGNFLASIHVGNWYPFKGLGGNDVSKPDTLMNHIENAMMDTNGDYYTDSAADSAATETAVSSASYRGATQVTINIYQMSPVVGDDGMRSFAQMIKEEFDELDYYGVGA